MFRFESSFINDMFINKKTNAFIILILYILIDFIDPLIVAENIAMAPINRFVAIRDFERELRDGQKGISGIGSMGKRRI